MYFGVCVRDPEPGPTPGAASSPPPRAVPGAEPAPRGDGHHVQHEDGARASVSPRRAARRRDTADTRRALRALGLTWDLPFGLPLTFRGMELLWQGNFF